ncbi:DJ-1/PfpI family protein [Flavobacterium sp.]|uniref:GlxA family transcriptional regulator n=1 Tax=Flavobacterium sp. TaxID=239 RepID=UPI00286E6656|nr:DJ-1/PfpI family protein [Flavobacterium sp.]
MKKIIFIIPPSVELLDLAGPVQVFTEAKFYGFETSIEFYSFQADTVSAVGLPFGKIENYKKAKLQENDFIFIPGIHFESLQRHISTEKEFFKWLAECSKRKINICSVCNAAFVLGEAGLLDNKECTTHWRRIDLLQTLYPKTKVLTDVLFAKSGNIYTSAGISAGIDLALSILEELTDPLFVNKVARGLVVYHRRSSKHTQQSIYLDYRNHINPKIHQAQDFLIENIASEISIEKLGAIVNMSPRNLSRVFKDTTEITIVEYLTKLRIEKAKTLKNNPEFTIEYIASECGYKSARQLQRILKSATENEK